MPLQIFEVVFAYARRPKAQFVVATIQVWLVQHLSNVDRLFRIDLRSFAGRDDYDDRHPLRYVFQDNI